MLLQATKTIVLDPTTLSAILATVLSLALSYIPGFKEQWERYPHKRTAWAVGGIVVAASIASLDYHGIISAGIPRPILWDGVISVISTWLTFAGAGQITYAMARSSESPINPKIPF